MFFTQTLHRQLRQRPEELATIDGTSRHTWREFVDRVARIAAGLHARGVSRGDRVGILSHNSNRVIEHAFACPWAGAVVCPVNFRWSLEEMAAQIDEAEIGVLFVGAEHLDMARELLTDCPSLRLVVRLDPDAAGAPVRPETGVEHIEDWVRDFDPVPDVELPPDELAILMYTGGTTGRPKGVMLSARNVLTSGVGVHVGVGIDNSPQRHLTVSPLFHLAALTNIYAQALLGSTLVQAPGFEVSEFADLIDEHQITSINVVPTMIAKLLDHLEDHDCDLGSLIIIGYGAEAIAPLLLERLRDRLPQVHICQRYGMTETGPSSTILTPADHRGDVRLLESVGRACVHADVRVVDAADEDVPLGQVGEIIVRGDHVMLGYWRRPEETAEALRGGWMHTGDAGRLDEHGCLFLADRIKDMIITGGENVYSAEVEKILIRHPAVSRVAVIGVPDADWGERVHAVVVAVPGEDVELEELREFAAERIARYKLPKSLQLIDALPLSPAGKVLKRALREDTADSVRTP
ncbi:long-chain-fatty-acid--CoA ligase [Brevibacterium atlanticum]|uniref:long-chain-fatty-acid--CoA ligase n=1 Tax=Brevibacterium atlanticum TaxID=2697563 RepID=UPI00141DF6F7|nr:long-chain-fatty-acid--CoA ligase [Brevibacterium atlanticum]